LKDESGFFLQFDNTGLLAEIGNPLPFRLKFTYQDGRLMSVRNIRTEAYGLTPSGLKLQSGATSPTETNEGPGVTFTYDNEGRIIQLRSTTGAQMDYTYNEQGRLARVTSNTQQAVEYRYDGDGRLGEVRRMEANGSKGNVLFGISYDERDRVKEVVNESGVTAMRMNYRWAEDRTTEVLLGQQHSVVTDHYDERGVVTERDELVRSDDPSQPSTGAGTRQTRECDERLNVTRMDRQDGTNTRWTYDDQGRLVRAQDSNGGFVEMSYNSEYGLVEYLRESSNGRWIRFLYGTATEGHSVTTGQIEEVQLDDGARFKLVYDDGGVPRELINATGMTEPLDLGLPPEVPKQLWEF
jgi:YD repeat-containing protein